MRGPRPAAALLGLALAACTGEAPEPTEPRYFYYLHGKIVEDLGPRGVSPRYGPYDYPGIVEALGKTGLTLVSEVRPKDTDPSAYADRVVADIRAKIRSGVPPSRITVAGASKGAVIAALVSTRLTQSQVRYVLIANCNDWLIREHDPYLTGEILSIYEASDDVGGSCAPLILRSPGVRRFDEVRLGTGLGHGVVYRPLDEWVAPAVAWAKR
jgi:hypothetical protein